MGLLDQRVSHGKGLRPLPLKAGRNQGPDVSARRPRTGQALAATTAWFCTWLDRVAPAGWPVVLIGFSGGDAFAGAPLLAEPSRFAGEGIL